MITQIKEVEEVENNLFYEDDSYQLPPDDLIAYNELRSCADLYRMYKQGILEIQPEFQREEVWKRTDQTRFIDSLIKQLPIPSMCFSVDYKTQRWQVIDGMQRMSTIIRFFSDEKWKLSNLLDIDPKISGKQVKEFLAPNSELYVLYRRVENLTLPITVLRCDYSKKSHTNYLFTIFHRLNTGGMKLNNQEIRNCIYDGSFNKRLKEMNKYPAWVAIHQIKPGDKNRFKTIEIILRFFAFYDDYKNYHGRLAKFLNDYMAKNSDINEESLNEKETLFQRTVDFIHEKFPEINKRKSISVLEAIMFGVAYNLDKLLLVEKEKVSHLFTNLLENSAFSTDALKQDLASKDKVFARLNAAKESFSGN